MENGKWLNQTLNGDTFSEVNDPLSQLSILNRDNSYTAAIKMIRLSQKRDLLIIANRNL
jgi:hypothetical protein